MGILFVNPHEISLIY